MICACVFMIFHTNADDNDDNDDADDNGLDVVPVVMMVMKSSCNNDVEDFVAFLLCVCYWT